MLSLIAVAIYLVVTMSCILAGAFAVRAGGSRGGGRIWFAIAALFGALAASRFAGLEDQLRAALRSWLVSRDAYESRRAIQGPIAALILGGIGVWAIVVLAKGRWMLRRGGLRPVRWASGAALAMIVLVALRIISFHPVDALLYAPIHLNWFADIGASAVVLLCATVTVRAAFAGARGTRETRIRHG